MSLVARANVPNASYTMNVVDHSPPMPPVVPSRSGSGGQLVHLGNLGAVTISGEIPCVCINGEWHTNCCPQCGIGHFCNFTCRGPLGFWVKLVPINPVAQEASSPVTHIMQYMPNPAITWQCGSPVISNESSPDLWIAAPAQSTSSESPPFQQLQQQQPQQQQLMILPSRPIPNPSNVNVINGNSNNNGNVQNPRNNSRGRRHNASRRGGVAPHQPTNCPPMQHIQQQKPSPKELLLASRPDASLAINRAINIESDIINNANIAEIEIGIAADANKEMPCEESLQPGPSSEMQQQEGDATPSGTVSVAVQANPGDNKSASANLKRQFCGFCYKNGESRNFYRAHCLRDSLGRIYCPVLLKYRCSLCGGTGQNAHTESYCPVNLEDEVVTGNGKAGAAGAVTTTQQQQPRQQRQRPKQNNYQIQWIGRRNATGIIIRSRGPHVQHHQRGSVSTASGTTSSAVAGKTVSTRTV